MLTTLKVGAEVDFASGDELAAMGSSILGAIGPPDPRPLYLSRAMQALGDGINPTVTVDIGSPPVGSIWQLRVATVFGFDDHTVVSGVTCGLYCGDPYNLSLASLKMTGLIIPSTTFIPDTAIWCHPNENVVLFATGSAPIAAGQQIGMCLTVEEWLEQDVSRGNSNTNVMRPNPNANAR